MEPARAGAALLFLVLLVAVVRAVVRAVRLCCLAVIGIVGIVGVLGAEGGEVRLRLVALQDVSAFWRRMARATQLGCFAA